jgi:SAM-dependent methyltransferase
VFERIAEVYDLAKAHRDYKGEADEIHKVLDGQNICDVLEVACGTGSLLKQLAKFRCTGLDISPEMLQVARRKLPNEIPLHLGDMSKFTLSQQFDAVLCLDGAIGYNEPNRVLSGAVRSMMMHLRPGGALLIEPWYTPAQWQPHQNHVVKNVSEDSSVILVRIAHGQEDGSIEFHNLVCDRTGVNYFIEHYKFWLYDTSLIAALLRRFGAKMVTRIEPSKAFKRGLLLAKKVDGECC